jgi:LPS export ABC transporter permease LptG
MATARSRILLLGFALTALGGLVLWWLLPAELQAIQDQLVGFPDSDIAAHRARPFFLAGLCFLPVLATLAYAAGDTLDRYLTRQFLVIFGICLSAFILIWLLIDLGDKISDFRDTDSALRTAAIFYGTRAPAIVLLLLPYSLLLSLLYSFGKLSGQREVIAIIQSGRSVLRMALPMVIAGVFCTFVSLGLNYHWAPVADGLQRDILAQASGNEPTEASHVLYRSRENRRLWLIGAFPKDYQLGRPLRDVEITLTHENRSLASRITASSATWNRDDRKWTLTDAVTGTFRPGEAPVFETREAPLTIDGWSETPWQLIKPGLSPAFLGIPDLNSWLLSYALHPGFADPFPYLTHWHYRWALPFACLVTVLLAAPLSIHFSRRGPGGGVFLAIVLSALMLLSSNVALALGESGLVTPALAAWLPNLIFGLIGIYLFHRRLSGRPIYESLRRLFVPDTD